ncbi:hypothetical protein MBLNU457_6344t1 [Dothideomycetes sp. NU457]
MNAGQRSARRLASQSTLQTADTICTSCLFRLSQPTTQLRNASTATATATSKTTSPPASTSSRPVPAQAYTIRTGVVLSRPPQLTRPLHPFEKAFYLYQKRLNERLALPFTRYFYYKKGTPADVEWKRKAKSRLTAARDIGVYNAYGREGWDDEVLVGDTLAETESVTQALIDDAQGASVKGEERAGEGVKKRTDVGVQQPLPRRTKADELGDVRSLDRMLDRTLYLLLRNKEGRWRFPEDEVKGKEGLDSAAERILVQSAGVNMNTWVVGNAPIGHYVFELPKTRVDEANKVEYLGEKVFFMKARIMAGQADMSKNLFGDQEMQWLTKEEIEKLVTPRYWASVRNMLTER